MGKYVGITAALALVSYLGLTGGIVDLLFGPEPEPEIAALPVLSHPLPYSITVTQSGHGIAKPVTRYHFSKDGK